MNILPGPWEYDEFYRQVLSGAYVICDVREGQDNIDIDHGNLLAAAPELLEALREIVYICNTWKDNHSVSMAREVAEKAIAKAEESE